MTTLLFGAAFFGAMLLLPLYYQVVRGESALDAGLLLAPQGIGAMVTMPIAGRLTDRTGAGPDRARRPRARACSARCRSRQVGAEHVVLAARRARCSSRGMGMGATMMPAMSAAYQTLTRGGASRAPRRR